MTSVAQRVARLWDEILVETPDPFVFYTARSSYRERLDRQPRNWRGELIPRIVTVRQHLRLLRKPTRPPVLPA